METPLAVFLPEVGYPSATFIRRHACDLLPGRTAVITAKRRPRYVEPSWTAGEPLLDLGGGSRIGACLRRAAAAFGGRPEHWRVCGFLRRRRVRAALGEFLDFSVEWVETAADCGVRFFAHAHGSDVSGVLEDPRWRAAYLRLNQAAGVVTMSRYSANRLQEIGIAPGKIHVIPYGVDVPETPPAHNPTEAVHCLAVGRAEPEKGPILLLDSFRRAAEKCPALRLDYIGSGRLLPAAREYVAAHGLESKVRILGFQPHHAVLEAMRRADLFLQHSRKDPDTGNEEGLPVAILEAMAHGVPVVSTREAGIPEAVAEGETGFLVNAGDTAAMGEAIVSLAADRAKQRRMGLAGWERARRIFSWPHERDALLRLMGLS